MQTSELEKKYCALKTFHLVQIITTKCASNEIKPFHSMMSRHH